jgi:hypothetical protein
MSGMSLPAMVVASLVLYSAVGTMLSFMLAPMALLTACQA